MISFMGKKSPFGSKEKSKDDEIFSVYVHLK